MLLRLSTLVLLLSATLTGSGAAQGDPADEAWRAGETRRAAELYAARLLTDSADVVALQRLALLRAWSGRHDEALALNDRWARVAPGDVEVRTERARILGLAGRYGEAMRTYDAVLAADAGNPDALRGRARIAGWMGDLVRSEAEWRAVLERSPADEEALVGLAQTLRWQGRDAAAAALLDDVLARNPANADALEQRRWVNVALRPHSAPRIVHERDSDGNRITSYLLGAGARIAARTGLRVNGYVRDARTRNEPVPDAYAYGGTITLAQQLEPGWELSVTGGAAGADRDDSEVKPVIGATLRTPARNRTVLHVSASRAPFDATSRLIERRVIVSDVAAVLTFGRAPGRTFDANAGVARFESGASGIDNTRISGGATFLVPVGPVRAGLRTRAFGFSRDDVFDGYYAPELYWLGEAVAQLVDNAGAWIWSVEAAPGFQRTGIADGARGSFRGTGQIGYALRPGRVIEVGGTYATAGVNALSADAADSYRYRSLWIGGRWGF